MQPKIARYSVHFAHLNDLTAVVVFRPLASSAADDSSARARTGSARRKSPSPADKVDAVADDLRATEASIKKHGLDNEPQHASDPLYVKRIKLILELIKLDAGYSLIAGARGVPASTNRGLCRVLEGGKHATCPLGGTRRETPHSASEA